MKATGIAFVVYGVTHLNRAREFYEKTLSLQPTHTWINGEEGMVEYDIGAGTLAIGAGPSSIAPSAGGGCAALEVEDFAAAIEHLRSRGCTFRMEPADTPVCQLAVIADPDGNSLMIHKRKGA